MWFGNWNPQIDTAIIIHCSSERTIGKLSCSSNMMRKQVHWFNSPSFYFLYSFFWVSNPGGSTTTYMIIVFIGACTYVHCFRFQLTFGLVRFRTVCSFHFIGRNSIRLERKCILVFFILMKFKSALLVSCARSADDTPNRVEHLLCCSMCSWK